MYHTHYILYLSFSIIHMLVLNAGIFNAPHQLTDDGLEQTYQVNHLSHFYLCHLLLPSLRVSRGRVVWVSAESHRFELSLHLFCRILGLFLSKLYLLLSSIFN